MVATGKATLPPDDNGLKRLISACFTVNCDDTQRRSDALFVEWRAKWDASVAPVLPEATRVSVKGLSNAKQYEFNQYCVAFKNHLKYGLIALYARTLRAVDGLSKREAEQTVARRLAGSSYFKGTFSKNTPHDPDGPHLATHQDAFALMVRCLRSIEATAGKNFHLAPLVGPSRRFMTLDAKQLRDMYAHYPSLRSADGPPTCLTDVFTLRSPRKNHVIGSIVRTDGVQVIARWDKVPARVLEVKLPGFPPERSWKFHFHEIFRPSTER